MVTTVKAPRAKCGRNQRHGTIAVGTPGAANVAVTRSSTFAFACLAMACGTSTAPIAPGDDAGAPHASSPSPRPSPSPSPEASTNELDGPIGSWVWHDVPGTICANGTQTGLGVNRGTADRVVVYMSGGSACLDAQCSIGTPSMRKDGGFGAKELAACTDGTCDGANTFPVTSIFDRNAATNPFADATYVFVSNCSGDYYVGDNEHTFPSWTARFHGSRNQALFAARVATAFPTASRIVLTGGSAGSIGAMLNYWQWVGAFPRTRVDLVSDSLAFVFADGPEWRYELHRPTAPPGCATCTSDYRTIYAFNASLAAHGARIAMLDSENNWTLELTSGNRYTQGLEALQKTLAPLPNVRYFVANGNEHILLRHALDSMETDVTRPGEPSRTLGAFLTAMQTDAPAWKSASCLGP